MLRQGILLLYVATLSLQSFAVETFKSVKFPSGSSLELPINIQQGPSGQIWLTSDSSISLFTSDQFILYKQFELTNKITASLVLPKGFLLATQDQVLYSLKEQATAPISMWNELNDVVTSLHRSDTEVVFSTSTAVYTVNIANLRQEAPKQLFHTTSELVEIGLTDQHIYALTNDALIMASRSTNQVQTFPLPQPMRQLTVVSNAVYALTLDNELVSLSVRGSAVQQEVLAEGIDSLTLANDRLFVGRNKSLTALTSPNEHIDLPFVTEQLYFDSSQNLWLLSPYDVQVKWQQSIELLEFEQQDLGRFDAYTQGYAIQQNRLFVRDQESNSWVQANQSVNLTGTKKIITTDNLLWLQTDIALVGLDRNSYKHVVTVDLNNKDLVLQSGSDSLLLITNQVMIKLDGNGLSSVVKSCTPSCFPYYSVNDHLFIDNQLLLATSQGLQTFNLSTLSFSSSRLDELNSVAAVLGITKAGKDKIWLLYPHKVALFDMNKATSEFYYSESNRLFSIVTAEDGNTALFSQKGWFKLKLTKPNREQSGAQINLHKVTNEDTLSQFVEPESILQLTATEQELRLAFNLSKQHSEQAVYFRFKYQDEEAWSQASQLSHSITLKNLRQGRNTLLMQARLEGQNWSNSRIFHYQMPYKYLQTKWVLFYAFLTFIAVSAVYLIERYKRFKIAFDTLKKETFINSLLESTKDGVWVANKDREIQSVNQAFEEISGFSAEEMIGKQFNLHSGQGRNRELESLIWQEVTKTGFWAGEVWSKKKTEEDISIDMSVTRVETCDKVSNKKDVRYVGVFSDVTDRKNSEKALRQLATRDPLTDLANRTLYIELIEQAISTANPANPSFGLMFIDLDNFSKVNANLGPLQGDELIKQVAQRLSGSFERGVSLARLTADEFALLIPNHLLVGEPAFYIRRLAGMIKRKLQPSFNLANTEVNISASMGVAFYPQHGNKPESLMRCADTALKKVKQSGKNNFIIYAKDLDGDETEVLSLESELIRAFDNDEFKVYYQPKYLVQQHVISGYEALVRWDNPDRGIVAPDKFIGIAEQNGLIRQLDSAVLKKVCEQIQYWSRNGVQFGSVAVNISALNFQQKEFCQTIQDILKQNSISPECIELEITESAMMSDPEQTLANLNELRSLGFTIALDDFGTGHSSLGHLKYFPIDRIKIDRSFVKDIETCDEDKNITSVIIQLAKHLNMKVIAEGVENQSQAYILHILGCNEIQGYFISKPLPADDVMPFLQDRMAGLPDIALD